MNDNIQQILTLLEGYEYLELRKQVGNKMITTIVQDIDSDDDDEQNLVMEDFICKKCAKELHIKLPKESSYGECSHCGFESVIYDVYECVVLPNNLELFDGFGGESIE